MDVLTVHEGVIPDHRASTSRFVAVRDARIQRFVDDQFDQGVQWPDPWLSLDPSFSFGVVVPDAVLDGVLHPEAERGFRRRSDLLEVGRDALVLHRHRLGRVADLHRAHRRCGAARPGRPHQRAPSRGGGDRHPPDERPGRLLGRELEKFLSSGCPTGGEPVTSARCTGSAWR